MKIAVGIPTYNGAERLDDLLTSIAMRTPLIAAGQVGIVLVDDGSPRVEETRVVARKWDGTLPLTYIEHGVNRGISAGWNTASRATDTPLVVLINDDVIVSSGGWLEALVHVLEFSPGVGVVGANWHAFMREDAPALLASATSDQDVVPRDPSTKRPTPERRSYEDTGVGRVMCPTGQLFAFRRKDFDAIGGFDEEMKSFYEESSFGTSMAAAGLIGAQLTWPFCWHLWSATFGANPELEPSKRMTESRLVYRRKWNVPDDVQREFDYTNPKYMGAIGDVPVEFLGRGDVVKRGVLGRDGAFTPSEG
jgi:GT2 family glycosyltransferase